MNRISSAIRHVAFAIAGSAYAFDVSAATLTVGSDGGCDYTSLQNAINALPASGFHEIRIAATQLTNQAVQISGRGLTLRGGYASCASATSTGVTTLNGQGGNQDSVVTIRGTGNYVILERMNLIRGDEVSDGYGGGLDFKGAGYVTLRDTAVSQNYAGYGGGISVIAENGSAELRLEAGSVIQLNTAQFSGGGVRLEGNARLLMLGANSTIANNEALGLDPTNNQPLYGYGGGLQVIAPAIAEIGSPGIGNGAIVGNTARYGGGIAVNGTDEDVNGKVTLFSTDPVRPVRVYGNRATATGGGVFINVVDGLVHDLSLGLLCTYDARIDGNVAVDGSAIYADSAFGALGDYGAAAAFNRDTGYPGFCTRPAASVRCAAGIPCNTIENNRTENISGTPTPGAAVLIQSSGRFAAARASIRGNSGAYAIRGFDTPLVELDSLLVADNVVSGPLLRFEDGSALLMLDSTIAGNTIGAQEVLSVNGDIDLAQSILWQPDKTSLTQSSGTRTVSQVIASETASLGGGAQIKPPRFVDPERGDFRLRAASPAIDILPATLGDDRDADGLLRDRRLAVVPRDDGFVRDLGAYERQTVSPLLFNMDFDADLHLWTGGIAGVSSWDATQNSVGASGSGSTKVTLADPPQARVTGVSQCIHLPGPGQYLLNGSGRTGAGGIGNRDYLYLNWEFRRAGGEACDGGGPTFAGDHFLSNSPSWQRPSTPKLINVAPGDWTSTSSINITLIVVENGITSPPTTIGWFDGITLEYVDPNDRIFSNGFDP
jgi:hypothetical protein